MSWANGKRYSRQSALVDVLEDISLRPSFWLDLIHPGVGHGLETLVPWKEVCGNAIDLYQLAEIMAYAVDAKSRFTYRHSHGVAAVSQVSGETMGLSGDRPLLLETAGLLHDLGKLTVPESILEKPGLLTHEEMNWIKQHTYYTYWFLMQAGLDSAMAEWAAFHHERLDGKGYPFGKSRTDLALEHRIIAVADIFTAVREDRPYRPAMDWSGIERVLTSQARSDGIDGDVVLALLGEKEALDDLWAELSRRLAVMDYGTALV